MKRFPLPSPEKASLCRQNAPGFSLIEIMLAMAIISFALVGIIGLFPAAMQSASNSQRETQATLIARSIFADLDSEIGPERQVITERNNWDSPAEGGASDDRSRQQVDLATPGKHYLAYDSEGAVLDENVDSGSYSSGFAQGAFIAEVAVEPLAPTAETPAGLSRVQVTVGAPSAAPADRRTSHTFVSLLRQNNDANSSSEP